MPDVYLEQARTVTTTVTTASWAWFDCAKWVPPGATALILSAECQKSGATQSVLEARADATCQTVKVFSEVAGVGYSPRSAVTIRVPLNPKTMRRAFQWEVTTASFGVSLSFKLIGYVLPDKAK